jgi:TPR repeat protein
MWGWRNAYKLNDHASAVALMLQAAERGHTEAQYVMGLAYAEGSMGLPVDITKAGHWMGRADASAKKHPRQPGPGQHGELAKSICRLARVQAPAPTAQQYFERGLQAEQAGDFDTAALAYAHSADLGHAHGLNNLGLLHENGQGVRRDYAEALHCYHSAARLGHAAAMANIADCYRLGNGVPKDFVKAADWYRKSTERGSSRGQYWLGMCHLAGAGLPTDRNEALRWLRNAATGGYERATDKLKELGFEQNERLSSGRSGMTRAEALEMLDLKEGATEQEVRAAYGRLMQQIHPDKSGSNFFAKQLNAAREVLLG